MANGREYDLTVKTGWEILPKNFKPESQTISQKAKFSDNPKDNIKQRQKWDKRLNDLKKTVEDAILERSTPPDREFLNAVIDKFHFPDKYKSKPVTLFEFIQNFVDNAPHRINQKTGKPVSYKSIREYHVTFGYLKEYAESKGREIDFKDITLDFYDDFVRFLESKELAQNTIGKKIRYLKIFLNDATDRGINTNHTYKSSRFKALKEDSESIYLTVQDLEKIFSLDLSNKLGLDRARDLFLIGCWTGLRYSDWDKIRPENIDNGFITLKQNKTGQPVVIPIHPVVNAILEKYNGNLPKPISNQKFNDYLKEVVRLADFKEAITKQITRGGKTETTIKHKWEMVGTHTARRSFATNMYKSGIPSITIMAVTGHRTESAFLKYIKVTPQEHAQRMRDMWLSSGNHLKVAK